jgi:probable biosynthetic protein (TIGR04098 family)
MIGMPEMAMGGLSESWLLKRLGHIHWQMIGDAAGVMPQALCDDSGRRLYPAFTRVRFASSRPLRLYREGERLSWTSRLSRFGGDLFFSRTAIAGEEGRTIEAEMMSSFALRAGAGNTDLARGKPVGADTCAAIALDEMPAFGREYQAVRARADAAAPVAARMRYDIVPQHDINGVGLLYFAAYPIIADICAMREAESASGTGRGRWAEGSTIARDVHYFANADADSGLEWRLRREQAEGAASEAWIVRDDGTPMAAIFTRREMP